MIRQPSIDVDKFPRTFALTITTFMNHCLNLTYKQLQYIYLHRLLIYVNFVEKLCRRKFLSFVNQCVSQMFMIFPFMNSKLIYSVESLSLKPMHGDQSCVLIVLVPYVIDFSGHQLEAIDVMFYVWKKSKNHKNTLHLDERPLIYCNPNPLREPTIV